MLFIFNLFIMYHPSKEYKVSDSKNFSVCDPSAQKIALHTVGD